MAKIVDPVDFSNLHHKQEEIRERYEGQEEFHSFLRGVLLGVLVSVPVQLLLKPLSLNNGRILYGSAEILNGISPLWFGLSVLFIFFLTLILIPLGYRWASNLNNWETVRLELSGDKDQLYEDAKVPLKEVCDERNLYFEAVDSTIVCKDPAHGSGGLLGRAADMQIGMMGIAAEYQSDILKLEFDESVSILHLGFAPESMHSDALLKKLETHFRNEYEEIYEDDVSKIAKNHS